MPIHDWTRVDAGLFHAFHQLWITSITEALNDGVLPDDHYALPEQRIGGPIPDVLALRRGSKRSPNSRDGGVAVADAPIQTKLVAKRDPEIYAEKKSFIAVRHRHGEIVAVIEIVSPGNKAAKNEFRRFIEKTDDLLAAGVHLLIVDVFPPSPRDPNGIHAALWDDDYAIPADKPLTAASYDAQDKTAYVEPLAVGDAFPDMPVLLRAEHYVPVPLESTYATAWRAFPKALKGLLE